MNRTNIPWVLNPDGTPGYTWNPITGCLNGCDYCYARKLANTRLRERYLANDNVFIAKGDYELDRTVKAINDPFYPRFWGKKLEQIKRPPYPFSRWAENAPNTIEWAMRQPPNYHARRKQVGIFVCSMSDLFGVGVPEEWTRKILEAIEVNSVDRFYLLTKQPQNLIKFSPFPDNCWVGVSATDESSFVEAYNRLICIEARVKYISLEPFLEWGRLYEKHACRLSFLLGNKYDYPNNGIDWLIIGAQTKPTVMPKIEWVKEIVEAADKAGVKVFLKDSLLPLLKPVYEQVGAIDNFFTGGDGTIPVLRQELPC